MAKANTEYVDDAVLQMMACNCCGRTASMGKYSLTPNPSPKERGVITAKG